MPAFWIVEHLDIVEDIFPSFGACRVGFSPDTLTFYQLKETFGDSIIVTVSAAAHALLQVMGIKEVSPVVTAELTSLIRVHHDRILRLPAPDGHQERIHC
jgi:hypothetical protein